LYYYSSSDLIPSGEFKFQIRNSSLVFPLFPALDALYKSPSPSSLLGGWKKLGKLEVEECISHIETRVHIHKEYPECKAFKVK